MARPLTPTVVFFAAALALAGCTDPTLEPPRDLAAPATDLTTDPDRGDVARPSCAEPLGGPALSDTSTEAKPGFDELLATLDLSQLPPRLDLTPASDLNRATVGYLLGRATPRLGTRWTAMPRSPWDRSARW